jgi:hypothetical protein
VCSDKKLIKEKQMNVLIFGGGSKWGSVFTQYIKSLGHDVDVVSSSTGNIKFDWNSSNLQTLTDTLAPLQHKSYDLVFFNHSAGGEPGGHWFSKTPTISVDRWQQNFWINCQLPYYAIKLLTLSPNAKIGWMVTGLIDGQDQAYWKHPGYAAAKSTNIHIMRGFVEQYPHTFFCINPCGLPPGQEIEDATQIYNVIDKLTIADSGKVFNKGGHEWDRYTFI